MTARFPRSPRPVGRGERRPRALGTQLLERLAGQLEPADPLELVAQLRVVERTRRAGAPATARMTCRATSS